MMDAGHIAQNLASAAESCGLGLCPVGAFFNDGVSQIPQPDGKKRRGSVSAPLSGKRAQQVACCLQKIYVRVKQYISRRPA